MTGRYRPIGLLLALLVLPTALRAQGYSLSDRLPYHAASVYYVTLQNAAGESVNSQYASTAGAIGAFVGGELRGVSEWQPTKGNEGVFVIRVWGGDDDQATASFHLRDKAGLEYEISTQPFAQGQEGTYGSPSAPVAMTVTPVTGISLPFKEVTLKQGETVSVVPSPLPDNHSTLLTVLKYDYSSEGDAFSVSSNGIVKALAVGEGKVTVKATPGNFTAQATIKVEAGIPYVAVTEIRNNMQSATITLTEGERLQLDYSVLPDNATNKAVSFKNNYAIVDIQQATKTSLPTIIAKKAGKDTLTVIAADNASITLTYYITVNERIIPDITLSFSTQKLTASKLHDTTLTLTKNDGDEVVPEVVELVFSKMSNGEPAATATKADNTGLTWNVRGQYVGKHTVKIKYNGKEQTATCTIEIPGEITFRNGWDWISLYTGATYKLTNESGDYLTALRTNDKNQIVEIRSQKETMAYDPTYGFFGDLTQLTAADGAYKLKSTYEEASEQTKVFNIGTTPGGSEVAAMMPQIETGYTWIGYPHERDHTLAALQETLSANAHEGDMIIGREAFLEFNGVNWQGSLKTFEAGKGYIYYTEAAKPFRLDWGDYYMASSVVQGAKSKVQGARSEGQEATTVPWHYDALQYASSMPVVAQLTDGIPATDVTVGAFVGGECRGYATVEDQGLLFLSVTGNPGERVSFMLYDPTTGNCEPLEQTVVFGAPQGRLRTPLMLSSEGLEVSGERLDVSGERLEITFDGTDVSINGASPQQPLTVSVYNLCGRTMLTTTGSSVVSLAGLSRGVYMVKATCGRAVTTIKIAK